jgi:hypothetical protein
MVILDRPQFTFLNTAPGSRPRYNRARRNIEYSTDDNLKNHGTVNSRAPVRLLRYLQKIYISVWCFQRLVLTDLQDLHSAPSRK